jgi:hypothetical protein
MVKEGQDFIAFSKNHCVLSVSVYDKQSQSIDLSSYQDVVWVLTQRPHSPDLIMSKSLSSGSVQLIDSGTNGVFTVTLSSSDLASLSGSYYHEALLIDNSEEPYTIMIGTAKIKKSAYDR